MTLARLVGGVVVGLAAALGFPPYDLWPLVPLAVAALTLLVRGLSLGRAAAVGLAAGLGFFALLLRWLTVIGVDAWLLVSLLEALGWALLGLGLAAVQRLRAWPLWAAGVWVLVELVRATVPLGGFPWGRLAFGVTGSPLLPWASIAGAAGLTFVVALAGQLIAYAVLAVRADTRQLGRAAAAVAGVAVLLGTAALLPLPTTGTPVTVAAVQGDVPAPGMDFAGEWRQAVLNNHVEATLSLAQQVRAGEAPAPDFVVWPENSSDIDPFRNPEARAAIDDAVAAVGVPVLVGTLVRPVTDDGTEPTTVENTGIVWDPVSGPGQRYVKRHPVPFGEYIPFRSLLEGVITRLDRIPRDFAAGDRPGVLDIGGTTIGDVICFEVAYDDLVRDVVTGGGQLLVVQTNNATYGLTGQPQQQFAISRLRAVEHGRPLVVAATSGISGVFAADGTVLAETAELEPALVVEQVDRREVLSVATRLGAWPEMALAVMAAVAVVLGWRRRPAARRQPQTDHALVASPEGAPR